MAAAAEILRMAPLLDQPEDWPDPDLSLVAAERASAPPFPGESVFGPALTRWIETAAEAKAAPADYVAAALLSVAAALIGNARWAAPWPGWKEPPVLWFMLIGNPSTGKSPALDAVLGPLREIECQLRRQGEADQSAWNERKVVADAQLKVWRQKVEAAAKEAAEPPARPEGADIGPEPWTPRLAVNDATVERLAMILGRQPRGTLVMRDELAGWLGSMTRYSTAQSDRAFWLETYGGRSFRVERVGRPTVHVDRTTTGVLGGIQPDRLASLLLGVDDDGLLARFLPVWPDPPPISRPRRAIDENFIDNVLRRLHSLPMATDAEGTERPWFVPFEEGAREVVDEVRREARRLEGGAVGLFLSHVGKAKGFVVRLALVLALLDWAAEGAVLPPEAVTRDHVGRAAHYIFNYALPMARRAYADAAMPAEETGARAIARLIHTERLATFTVREVQQRKLAGLRRAADIKTAVEILVSAGWVTFDPPPSRTKKRQLYRVNPRVWR